MPDPAQDALAEPIEQVLRSVRPGPGDGSEGSGLEKRLAVASILAATGAERAPTRIGRLEVQSRIGGGAMGVVYRAYDPELQRLVAVKLMRSWTGREERQQIVEEARRLAQLTHPNVVAVYDIVDDDDGLYFAMEYVAGTTLQGWLRNHPSAGFREILEWFVQAGRGLAAAHDAGMVHRDFKPDNVLVGDDGRVRVADFGLARVLQARPEQERAGTPGYMAPEVERDGVATPASDQYSFCVALREALAEHGPPEHVRGAIARGLEADPTARHPGMGGLVDLLEAALSLGTDGRPRALLLDRVERLWLRGVLDRSLGSAGVADLTLVDAPELVAAPWNEWEATDSNRPSREPRDPTRSRSVGQLLDDSHGALLLLGPPGAGKTTTLLTLCRELWRRASLDPQAPAPAVLSLSTFRPETDAEPAAHFGAWVVDELVVKYGLARPAVERWLDEQGLVLLLDGLDETDSGQRERVVEILNAFRRQRALPLVVTCRDSEYEALDTRLAFGGAAVLQPLDDDALNTLLEERHSVGLIERISEDAELRESLRNPLLLSLYAGGDPDREVAASSGWAQAYGRYVQQSLSEVDAAERRTLTERLAFLASVMRRHNTSDLWLERIGFGWLGDGATRAIAYASGVLAIGLFALGINLGQQPITKIPIGTALIFGLGVWGSALVFTRGRISPVASLRWSGRRSLRLLPLTMTIAVFIGALEGLKFNFVSNLLGGVFTGAIAALVFALEPSERATRVSPNAGIHQSLRSATLLSVAAGIPTGLLFALVLRPYILSPLAVESEYTAGDPNWIVGMGTGLFILTAMFLIYGGFAVIMHYVVRLWLALTTPLPLNLSRLLDRAAELGLMRRVGGGYVFLHRTLLDYFADGTAAAEVSTTED